MATLPVRSSLAVVFLALVGASAAGSAISACVGDDGSGPITAADAGSDAPPPISSLKTKGLPCANGNECQTGVCSDSVCCEAKCDGVCEKCNLPGNVGTCAAIPTGQDPDNECPTTPLATSQNDAGTTEEVDAGDEAGTLDAGLLFVLPDGGYPPTTSATCAGKCNGNRACAFPNTETTCGQAFCGNDSEQGVATCDGSGHCLYGVQECTAYACADGSPGCKTTCTSQTDCLPGFFCEGSTQTCKAQLANGTSCTDVTQCKSGVCDTTGGQGGVCCDSDCTGVAGGSCRAQGKIGQCTCSACSTGPCAIYYKDADGDTYGDAFGTVAAGTAMYACADATPAGFSKTHDDCLDGVEAVAASVHPNQAQWFTTPYTNHGGQASFDYNCSGAVDKEIGETNNCGYCSESELQAHTQITSSGVIIHPVFCSFSTSCPSTTASPGRACLSIGGCGVINTGAFLAPFACGASATTYKCTPCTAAGGPATENASAGTQVQACH